MICKNCGCKIYYWKQFGWLHEHDENNRLKHRCNLRPSCMNAEPSE